MWFWPGGTQRAYQNYSQRKYLILCGLKQTQGPATEIAAMQDHIEPLKPDLDAIERESREKLHYTKPGEVINALQATPPKPATDGN